MKQLYKATKSITKIEKVTPEVCLVHKGLRQGCYLLIYIEKALINSRRKCSSMRININEEKHMHIDWPRRIGKVSWTGVSIPHKLSKVKKTNWSTTCNILLERHNTEAFFESLIRGNERWALHDDSNRKRQWFPPSESLRSSGKASVHPKKVVLCVWKNIRGIVYIVLKPI